MTIPEYSRRMNRVLDYIDLHLDEPLELDDLAAVANFSQYHFHRVFSAWLGETLGNYLLRRRLAVGATRLTARSSDSVLSVALSVGFGSGEAFARAFKRQFNCTPTAWRAQTPQRWAEQLALARSRNIVQQRNLDHGESNLDQVFGGDFGNHGGSDPIVKGHRMEVRLIDIQATKVAYMRIIGANGAAVADFWTKVFNPWMSVHGLDGRSCYGIIHDDPYLTPPSQCRYDCCVEVPDSFVATGKAVLTTLPGGRYAAARFKGTAAMIANAWTEMFREWLPASGLRSDSRPFFNRYPTNVRLDPKTGVFDCELCLPVCPL